MDTLFAEVCKLDFSSILDPINAEEFARKNPFEKFQYHLKWASETFVGKNGDDKFKLFDKPLEKKCFKVFTENNFKYYDSRYEIEKELSLSQELISYLLKVRSHKINKPKFKEYFQYHIQPVNMILKENSYIEVN